jgi:hypothetical protein
MIIKLGGLKYMPADWEGNILTESMAAEKAIILRVLLIILIIMRLKMEEEQSI